MSGSGGRKQASDKTKGRQAKPSAGQPTAAWYRALYEDSPSMYFTVSGAGVVLSVNRFGAEQLGYRASDLVGQPVSRVFHEEDRALVERQLASCVANPGRIHSWEFRKVRRDGTILWVREAARVVDGPGGEPVVLIVCEDITERKRAEEALAESGRRYALATAEAKIGVWDWNIRTGEFFLDPNIKAVLGYEDREIPNDLDVWVQYVHPEDREGAMRAAAAHLEGRTPEYVHEHRMRHKDGSVRWILVRGVAHRDETGRAERMIGTDLDITARKRAELALRALVRETAMATGDEFFRALVRTLAETLEVRYAFVSERAGERRVRTLASWVDRAYGENFEYDVRGTPCEAVLAGEAAFWPRDVQQRFPEDQELVRLQAEAYLAVPIHGSDQRILGHAVVIDDRPMADDRFARPIMELGALRAGGELARLRALEALRRSEASRLEALRQADAAKSALLSSVSHELRTPLAAMKASLSELLREESPATREQARDLLLGLNQEVDSLARLVDNLLNMSQIEADALRPQYEWFPLEELVEVALSGLGPAIQRRELVLDLGTDLPPVRVDGIQIKHVLVNLLDNALKYSREGSPIRLEARARGEEIEVRVASVGDPIPPAELPRLFERFYRVPMSRPRPIRGTGLGLAISRSLIESHGGRIRVESTTEGVTTVTFTLPRHEPPPMLS